MNIRRRGMPPVQHSSPNVTPLVDIVMCLVIFFMLVAKIGVDTGADQAIDIPESIRGIDLHDLGNMVTLNVVNGPTGIADAQPIVTALVGSQMVELKLRQAINGQMMNPLRDTLKHFHEGNNDFKVIIRGDKSLTYRFLAPVLAE